MQKKLLTGSILLNVCFVVGFLYVVQALGGWTFLKYKMKNRGLGSEYDHRKSLIEKMPINRGDIVFLGNSITAQCDWAELLNNPKIKNRGIPGDMTDGVMKRIGTLLDSIPSKLFLMIGVNDLLFHNPDYVIDNYKKIVNEVKTKSPRTKLFVYSILPINSSIRKIPIRNKDIQIINRAIEKIAKDNELIFIDLYPVFADKDGSLFAKFTSDGIHLNGDAYLLWKSKIEEYLIHDF